MGVRTSLRCRRILREAVDIFLKGLDAEIASYGRVFDVPRGRSEFSERLLLLTLD